MAEQFNEQEARAAAVIVNTLGCPPTAVTRDATLESLGADSLDSIQLSIDLEEHFNIEISDDEATSARTVADVFAVVKTAVQHEEDAK